MTRLRAILSATAGFAAVLLLIWEVNHWIVQPAFVALEQAQALEDGARARAAIQGELRQLGNELGDWAEWDDAYAFAESRNSAFIQSNLGDWRVLEKSSGLNLCLIVTRDGQVLYSGGYDSDLRGAVVPMAFAGEHPAILTLLQPALARDESLTGLLLTEHGLLLLAARPVLTTQGTGPARGMLAFGRFLDESLLQTLAAQIQGAFVLFPAGDQRLSADEQALLTTLPPDAPVLRPGQAGRGFVYAVLADLAGNPAALLRTPIRQEISATAQRTSRTLLATLGLAALALILAGARFSARFRLEESAATDAVAWGITTLVVLIGWTLSAGLFWELRRHGRDIDDHLLAPVVGAGITLLLARYLFAVVSQRRRAEALVAARTAELRESEHKFRSIVEHAPLGFHLYRLAHDDRLVLIGANPAADAILKQRHVDLLGQTIKDAFPILAATEIPTTYRRLAREGGVYRWDAVEYRDPRVAGTFEVAAFQTAPGMIAVAFADITERRRAEQRLRQSEEKFAKIFLSTPDVVVISRVRDGLLLEVNPGFEATTGYSRAEAVGRSALNLGLWADPVDRERLVTDLRLFGQVLYRDFPFRRKDGALRTGQFSARPITIDEEPCLLFVMQDITERQRAEEALRASEERLRGIANNIPGVVFQFYARPTTGEMGLCYLSERTEELFGLGDDRANAFALFTAHVVPEDREPFLASIQRAVETASHWDFEGRFIKPTGEEIWFKGISSPTHFEQELVYTGVILDITEQKRAEAALRDSEARYRIVALLTGQLIYDYDCPSGQIKWAGAIEAMTSYEPGEFAAVDIDAWAELIHPEDRSHALERLEQAMATGTAYSVEYRLRRKEGSYCWVDDHGAFLLNAEGKAYRMLGTMQDITARKQSEQRIEHLALYDALTDLPNRALLAQRAELALALAARHRVGLALLFLDLDRFKEVNDSLGHAEGDALLVQAAARLRDLVRETDTVCRLGGDEFVLLLPEAGREGALQVADKVLAAFRQPFAVNGHSLRVTASVGIALYPHDGQNIADLLKNADAALYQAKQDGRNTWTFYDREMSIATFERLMLEAELRKAIAMGQLRAYFQPKIRLVDSQPIGAEALVRWQHPDHGLIPPGQFIPVAEASDLIVELGDWMLAEVCRQLVAWRDQDLPPLTVAVNLAARHFQEPGLISRLEALLAAHGLPPRMLELELTETSLLAAGPRTAETLLALERLGVGLAIDDFGIGYSSLGYLKRLPITALKIDHSFVRDLASDPDDRILAATIVALGHSLGLAVVAEGVETEEQRRLLLDQGCDLAQGYLFGLPMPADAFIAWWNRSPGSGNGSVSSGGKD